MNQEMPPTPFHILYRASIHLERVFPLEGPQEAVRANLDARNVLWLAMNEVNLENLKRF